MKITVEQVRSVAELARLELGDEEAERLSSELSELVQHFERLDELETAGVQPTSHAVPLSCPQREDALQAASVRELILGQAPRREDGYFVVPKVIE